VVEVKAVGIIVEYNPFHNGHKIHLEEAKKEGDLVIAVMSGNFLQRGEPAIYSKEIRAKMAINNGVDLVIELPIFYANQSAEIFSYGSVDILNKVGVKTLVFGSESENLEKLLKIAKFQIEEKELLNERVKKYIKSGISYPNAMNNVLKEELGELGILESNDILGLEYIKAIKKLKCQIKPKLIERKYVGYHDEKIVGDIASATLIRNKIKENKGEISKLMPLESYKLLGNPVFLEDYYRLIRYEIINNFENLKNISDMEQGLENRIYKMAIKYENFSEFYDNLMTKRYTNGRIQRILTHILLKIDKKIVEDTISGIGYAKILGFSELGAKYLKKNKGKMGIKLLSGLKNVSKILDDEERRLLNFEIKCDRIYRLGEKR
jgi:cytidyltransferase-like protein